jgi:hypothetical protein
MQQCFVIAAATSTRRPATRRSDRNQNGNSNTANGENALAPNTTGSNNIAIEASAGFHLTIGSNNIDIGNKGVADESNTIRIGTKGTQHAAFIAGIYGTPTAGTDALPVVIDSDGQLGTASGAQLNRMRRRRTLSCVQRCKNWRTESRRWKRQSTR